MSVWAAPFLPPLQDEWGALVRCLQDQTSLHRLFFIPWSINESINRFQIVRYSTTETFVLNLDWAFGRVPSGPMRHPPYASHWNKLR